MVESGQTDDGNVSNIATKTFCIVPSYLRCLDLLDLSGVVPTIGEKYFALTFPVTTLPPLPPCQWSVVLLSPGLQESLSPVSWTAGLSISPCKCDSPPPYTFLSRHGRLPIRGENSTIQGDVIISPDLSISVYPFLKFLFKYFSHQ